jgi:hypothetical protein
VLADATFILPHLALVAFDELFDPWILDQMLHVKSRGGSIIVIDALKLCSSRFLKGQFMIW